VGKSHAVRWLDAARFGQAALDERFTPDTSKPPRFEPSVNLNEEEEDQLAAFGCSRQEHPLFPFNKAAVRQLGRERLRDSDGRLTFNPRYVITKILHPLLKYRQQFVDGLFPTSDVLGFTPREVSVDLQNELRELLGDEAGRYLALPRYWGDNPPSLGQAALSEDVFHVFALPPLRVQPRPDPRPPVPGPKPHPAEGSPPSPASTERQVWSETLEAWFRRNALPHADANKIRTFLQSALHEAMDWDRELMRPCEFQQTWVYLPNALGNKIEPDAALVTLCRDEVFLDEEQGLPFKLEVRALIRRQVEGSWNYEGGDVDAAQYANLVERGVAQAVEFCRRRYDNMQGDPVPSLVQALLFGARVLGLNGASSRQEAKQLAAVFDLGNKPRTTNHGEWDELRSHCYQSRPEIRDALLRLVGVRQGGGKTVNGLDAARVLEAIALAKTSWKPQLDLFEGASGARAHISLLRRSTTETAIKKRREALAERRRSLVEWLGQSWDKQQLVEQLQTTVRKARDAGVYRGDVESATLLDYINRFRELPIVECLETLDRVTADDESPAALVSLAQVDDAVLDAAEKLKTQVDRFWQETTRKSEQEIAAIGEDVLAEAEREIEQTLVALHETLEKLEHPQS